MIVTLLGKRWRLRRPVLKTVRGDCDAPSTSGKEIRVDRRLNGEEELEVLIHECSHAAFWALDESYIERGARDLARVLWRIGYRKKAEPKPPPKPLRGQLPLFE